MSGEKKNELLEAICAAFPQPVVAVDGKGLVTFCNAAAERLLGWRLDELLGRPIGALWGGDEAVEVARLKRLLAGEALAQQEVVRKCKDGRLIPLGLSAAPLRDAAGRVAGVVGVYWLLRGQKAMEENLRVLTQAVQQSGDAVIITDDQGFFQYVNPSFVSLTGYSLEELAGQTPRILKSGETSAEEYDAMWRALRAGRDWHGTVCNRTKSGAKYWARLTIGVVRGDSGRIMHYVGVQENITKEREQEAELRQAQKMETVGRLAGGVAHDFNNLLTAMMGYAELVRDALPAGDPMAQDVQEILKAGWRASALTGQLLAFSRKQIAKPAVVDLNRALFEMDKMLRRLLGAGFELVILPDPEVCKALVDPSELEQVIVNLVVNARDAMPNGGRLLVQTEARPGAGSPPGAESPDGRCVVLRVVDSGVGMTEEVREHIFEPFFTTKEKGKGTGLGLATSYAIVARAGGRIAALSAPGKGSTFEVVLPFCDQPVAEAQADSLANGNRLQGSESVLVVDDDELVRRFAARTLRRFGYTVLEASNGEQALRLLEGGPAGAAEIVVTDLVMPILSGQELAARLKATHPHLRTVFTSGYVEEGAASIEEAVREGTFLEKPFTAVALARKVRQALDRRPR